MATNFTGVLFLDRNGFLIFSNSINRVLQFNFAPDVVRDLEVIDPDKLAAQLSQFFTQSGLQPFQSVIILSENLLFEKQFSTPQNDKDQQELNVFLENLPFEHVGSIIYTNQGTKFVATNKELYQTLAKGFEKLKCTVDSIVPAFALNVDINQFLSLNPQTAQDLFRRGLSLKQYSFLKETPPKITPSAPVIEKKTQEKPTSDEFIPPSHTEEKGESNSRLFLLVGVFVLLLAVLGVVAFTML